MSNIYSIASRVTISGVTTSLVLFSLFTLLACGGGSSGSNGSFVTRVFFDDDTISVGESSVATVQFTFSADAVFDDRTDVILVLRIPEELNYRSGSSEVSGFFGDKGVGPEVTFCDSGEQYLSYRLDRGDLGTAINPGGDADAELTLTLDSKAAIDPASVSAAAQNDFLFFECGGVFTSDAAATLRIFS